MPKNFIKIVETVCDALLHPINTLMTISDYILAFIPAVCVVLFLFFIVTGNKKILGAMFFTTLVFILIKVAIVFNFIALIGIVVVAILIIRLVGGL